MPNRILRESITTSETLNELSPEEEIFFYRLIVVADDYGLMDARPAILKARCFPLKDITPKHVEKCLVSLAKVGLIDLYEHGGKPYLSIRQWDQHQRIRNARAKYPMPADGGSKPIGNNSRASDSDPRTTDNKSPSESESNPNPIQSESESEMSGKPDASRPTLRSQACAVLQFLNEKTGKAFQPVDVNLDLIVSRLKEGATAIQCRQVIVRKSREWLGDEKMAEYLRPATLFGKTKFAQYVGELVAHE